MGIFIKRKKSGGDQVSQRGNNQNFGTGGTWTMQLASQICFLPFVKIFDSSE